MPEDRHYTGMQVFDLGPVIWDAASMATTNLETPAWLMKGVVTYNAKLGTLRLDGGRLSFRETGAQAPAFDIALADIDNVTFPAYNFGSVVRIDAGADRYR